MDTGAISGGKARPKRDANHSPHLVPRSRMSRSYTPLSFAPAWRWRDSYLYFTLGDPKGVTTLLGLRLVHRLVDLRECGRNPRSSNAISRSEEFAPVSVEQLLDNRGSVTSSGFGIFLFAIRLGVPLGITLLRSILKPRS
jgi:hypothetical protein